jgi:hypothetical protein
MKEFKHRVNDVWAGIDISVDVHNSGRVISGGRRAGRSYTVVVYAHSPLIADEDEPDIDWKVVVVRPSMVPEDARRLGFEVIRQALYKNQAWFDQYKGGRVLQQMRGDVATMLLGHNPAWYADGD